MRSYRLLKILRILSVAAWYRLTGNKPSLAQAIYRGFSDLGGIYIKFLQILLLRSDLFGIWHSVEHWQIYEDVGVEPLDIKRLLDKELGDGARSLQLDSEKPFTAGSFGQVYKATLPDGSPVIIKALRPSLTDNLHFDLRLIGMAARCLSFLKPGSMFDYRKLFSDFRDTTLQETDYVREASMGEKLYDRYRGHPRLVIPRTYHDFCTKRLIVQEFIGGISAARLLELQQQGTEISSYVRTELGSDLNQQLGMLGFELLYGVFDAEVTQGDPHPGNVKLMSGNRVGLIDFGIITEVPSDRSVIYELLLEYRKFYSGEFDARTFSVATLRLFSADLVAAISVLDSLPGRRGVGSSVLDEIGTSAAETVGSTLDQAMLDRLERKEGLMTAALGTINPNNRFGLRLRPDAPSFVRATQMFIVLADSLKCKRTVLSKVFDQVINTIGEEPRHFTNRQRSVDVNQAFEVVAAWLDRVSRKDPVLFNRLTSHLSLASARA